MGGAGNQTGEGTGGGTSDKAAAVVKRVFDLCIAGKGPAQIAKIRKAERVLIAKAYYAKQKGKALPENPYNWEDSAIVEILERMDDISGAISHDRFLKLSAEYEAEQKELEEKVKFEQQKVDTYEQNKSDQLPF